MSVDVAYGNRCTPISTNSRQLSAVRRLLETMLPDLVSSSRANAPIEDEEISEEEELSVAEARKWSRHNNAIAHEEVLADFGLTMTDFEPLAQMPLAEESRR